MGPRISARFSDPQSSSTSVRANGNAVPGPRLNVVNANITVYYQLGNELWSNSYVTTYLVMRLPDTTTDSSIYSKSTRNQKTLCLITIIITVLELSLNAGMRCNLLTRQFGHLCG